MAVNCAAAASFWPCLKILGVAPDVILGVLASYAPIGGEKKTAAMGLVAGLLRDMLCGGYFMFLYPLLYFLAGWGFGKLQELPIYHGYVTDTVSCAAVYVVMQLMLMAVAAFTGAYMSAGMLIIGKVLPGMLYTVLIMAPNYFLMRRADMLFDGGRNRQKRLNF